MCENPEADVSSLWREQFDQNSEEKTDHLLRTFHLQEAYQIGLSLLILLIFLRFKSLPSHTYIQVLFYEMTLYFAFSGRLIKYSRIDSRMALIMDTLSHSWTLLLYFLIVFLTTFVGFVFAAQIYLGFYR